MKKIAKEELCTIIYIKKNLITNKTETCNKVQIKKNWKAFISVFKSSFFFAQQLCNVVCVWVFHTVIFRNVTHGEIRVLSVTDRHNKQAYVVGILINNWYHYAPQTNISSQARLDWSNFICTLFAGSTRGWKFTALFAITLKICYVNRFAY